MPLCHRDAVTHKTDCIALGKHAHLHMYTGSEEGCTACKIHSSAEEVTATEAKEAMATAKVVDGLTDALMPARRGDT